MQKQLPPEVHVIPYRDVWAVEALGIKYLEFSTREQAIAFGRVQAEKKQAELIVHDRDGNVAELPTVEKQKQPAKTERHVA